MSDEREGCTVHINPEDNEPLMACQRESTELQIVYHEEDHNIESSGDSGSEQRDNGSESSR